MADKPKGFWLQIEEMEEELKKKKSALENSKDKVAAEERKLSTLREIVDDHEAELIREKCIEKRLRNEVKQLNEDLSKKALGRLSTTASPPSAPSQNQSSNNSMKVMASTKASAIDAVNKAGEASKDAIGNVSSSQKTSVSTGEKVKKNKIGDSINKIYTTVVAINGEYFELRCSYCQANSTCDWPKKFLQGVAGLQIHVGKAHEVYSHGPDALEHLTQRKVSDRDVKLMSSNPPQPPQDCPILLERGTRPKSSVKSTQPTTKEKDNDLSARKTAIATNQTKSASSSPERPLKRQKLGQGTQKCNGDDMDDEEIIALKPSPKSS